VSAEDAFGHAFGCSLTLGQAHEVPLASLLTFLTILPFWIVDDRGYASHAFHELIWGRDARPAIPPKHNEAPVVCSPWIYRNRIKHLWNRLKEWCAVATGYKTPSAPSWAFLAGTLK
jgi:hypothetical protein